MRNRTLIKIKEEHDKLNDALWKHLLRNVPRILSQLDRDPDSPTFGSFDRNFWHYKIRDFSSMIIQQGMLIIDALKSLEYADNPLYNHPLADKWIDGCLRFWASQQLSNGSFNEYYPFEEGYPPTAFTLHAVGLIFQGRKFPEPTESVGRAIQKTCDWVICNPEKEALNQESAGLAGIAIASKIPGIKVDSTKFEERLSEFFKKQSEEGWFIEYGGPDLGYLSVTLDCLWSLYDVTGDVRAKEAIDRAVNFYTAMVAVSGNTPVMVNSRNTEYVVPYGLVRAGKDNPAAAAVVRALYRRVGKADHFLCSTDDRYACHYVYQSCFRSLPLISQMSDISLPILSEKGGEVYLKEAGILVRHIPGKKSIFVAGQKGGITYSFTASGLKGADFGWRSNLPKGKIGVTHWQDAGYKVEISKDDETTVVTTNGVMSAHGMMKSSPLRHTFLRVSSFLFGKKLIPILKKIMIFDNPPVNVKFCRKVFVSNDEIKIEDSFFGIDSAGLQLRRAPIYSMRHVSSAGSFALEELVSYPEETPSDKPTEGEVLVKILK